MGIFDNATSVTIDGNTVESITIDGATVYEAEVEPVTRTLSFSVLYDNDYRTPVQGVSIWLDTVDDDTFKGVTGSAGGCTISNVGDGEHNIYLRDDEGWTEPISINGSSTVNKIEVSENQTSFEILLFSPV